MSRGRLQRARRAGLGALAAALVLTALALPAAPASAQVRAPEGVFCEPTGLGAPPCAPSFSEPKAMAAVPAGLPGAGDLLVIDAGAKTISRFKPDGEADPFAALGTNTIDGMGSWPTPCSPPSLECDGTPQNGLGFGFAEEMQIAVAPADAAAGTAGDIYVTYRDKPLAPTVARIDVFAPDGRYLGQLGESSLGPFERAGAVAVDPSGNVYVGDGVQGIHKYSPSANPPLDADNSANFGNATTTLVLAAALAAGTGPSAGSLFAASTNGKAVKLDAATGALQYPIPTPNERTTTLSVEEANGRLLVATGPIETPHEVREYDASGAGGATLVSRIASEEAGSPVEGGGALETRVNGIAVPSAGASAGRLYVALQGSSDVGLWGPDRKLAPVIEGEAALAVGAHQATLGARIGAEEAPTEYHFEYGTAGPCSSNPCATSPSRSLPAANPPVAVEETLALEEGTAYWWRLVATNSCEPEEGSCGTSASADHRLHTFAERPSPPLLDERVWELSSPPRKENAELAVPGNPGGQAQFNVEPQQASRDGEAVTYASFTSFDTEEGDAEGSAIASQYVSRRTPEGWRTENATPYFEEGDTRDPLVGFSPDLRWAAAISLNPPLAPGAAPDVWNVYRRDNLAGAYDALTAGIEPRTLEKACLLYAGAAEDFSRIYLAAYQESLLPTDPAPALGYNLYEWSEAGGLRLASVLPSGAAAAPQLKTALGAGPPQQQNGPCNMSSGNTLVRGAVSANGLRAFWTYGGQILGSPLVSSPLLARLTDPETGESETVQLDALQGKTGSLSGGGKFWGASAEGRFAFFTDGLIELTPTAKKNDLFRYDVKAREEGEPEPLEDITTSAGEAANVQGVLGISGSGDAAYFVAKGALSGENAEHESPLPGALNLYAWREGQPLRFIATLGTEDKSDWSEKPGEQTARVSPNGMQVAFLSREQLSGYDNTELAAPDCGEKTKSGDRCREAYTYDLGTEKLRCASCNPTGARPAGSSDVPRWAAPYEQPRYLDDSGRLFFQSKDALDVNDINGRQDVYEFEPAGVGECTSASRTYTPLNEGCVALLSSGQSEDESYLLDASTDGRDVFLSTRSRLVPQLDRDGAFDVYDARVGGTPPPPEPPPGCEGEACRGQGTAGPAPAGAGTAAFQGAGNPAPRRRACPKGRRAVRRHGKTRCLKRHGHHRKRHRRHHRRAHRAGRAGR